MSLTEVLHSLLDEAATARPDQPAVSTDISSLTYGELAAASHNAARRLHAEGVRRGDRVVITTPDALT
ncbi:AMP-binding protein, partial [[Kitasatospora] papulosa]